MPYTSSAPTRAIGHLFAPAILLASIAMTGCARYATPGSGARMQLFATAQQADSSVSQALARQPLAKLPAAIAVVRVQAPGYTSATAAGWGRGAYSIVTTRDIEGEAAKLDELQKLPKVIAVAPVNRLLLAEELHSDLELREAAGAMHADMLLIYTLDTTFTVQDAVAPLTVVTLGLSPNQLAHVVCTASAVLIDTRNGYVYGVAEATEHQNQLASAWTSDAAVDQTRRRTEAAAFAKLVSNLQATWTDVVKNLGGTRGVGLVID